MFTKLLQEVTKQVELKIEYECKGKKIYIYDLIKISVEIWCYKLEYYIDIHPKNISNYIFSGYRLDSKFNSLSDYLYTEWANEKSQLYKLITPIVQPTFKRIIVRRKDMRIVVIIGFVITAVGYLLYIINRQKATRESTQQITYTTPLVQSEHLDVPASIPLQTSTKPTLVLVISASNQYFVESLKMKGIIDINDAKQLMKITKFLWLGSNDKFKQIQSNFNQYSVSEIRESPDDIFLLYFTLKEPHHGFQENKNDLDRYDAFDKLASLETGFTPSPRLRMEALDVLEFYSL
ncbi:hypothetical protein FJR38_10885 [Anabaena sp. UHCC 0253]|uniref:hypothetical protein n=1 Tax=Anabaena sp. UHCC 0253 TaxID=2590019 RepID=UPI00144539B3|nr:hypothetical protein [Anabaena sp. UHCC 0253]MTJ53108.1 hypothetical protein [Anabaena sp. UHCC 0253]